MYRKLSVFIDESGDLGPYRSHSPYYLVAMLFHDQEDAVDDAITALDERVKNAGFEPHAIHTGPIVRREERYRGNTMDERKKLLGALMDFGRHANVKYTLLRVDKKDGANIIDITAKLSKQILLFVTTHLDFFQKFDEIVVYYDNGQIELTRVFTSALTVLLSNVDFRLVKPSDYKLFQLVDMFCSLELIAIKFETNTATRSDTDFFHSRRDFRKNYLKTIRKKRLL
ncbi:MAG: DUF3800 domain-containing protein [Clostridiales Family XIII bacterium]|nr:DUF3800 domain-containing protein [Clostridiales Family XIII bacterium]